MTKEKKTRIWIAVATVVALCIASSISNMRGWPENKSCPETRHAIKDALTQCLDGDESIFFASLSITHTGSAEEPYSYTLSRNNYGSYSDRFSNDLHIIPIVPGGIMQIATAAFFLDEGKISLDQTLPTDHGKLAEVPGRPTDVHIVDYEMESGRDSISIKEGLLGSFRYVTDRYLLDLNKEPIYYNLWPKFINWRIGSYFGWDPAQYLPQSIYRQSTIKDVACGVADGHDLMFSQLQILTFIDCIANDGIRHRHSRYIPSRRLIQSKTATEVSALLRENVTKGTGILLSKSSVAIAGKTGAGTIRMGWIPTRNWVDSSSPVNVSSFVGFFPAENPKYTMCVSVYCPKGNYKTGSAVRVFGQVVKQLNDEGLL